MPEANSPRGRDRSAWFLVNQFEQGRPSGVIFAPYDGPPKLADCRYRIDAGQAAGQGRLPSIGSFSKRWGDVVPRLPPRRSRLRFTAERRSFPDRIEPERGEDYPIFRNEHDLATIQAVGDFRQNVRRGCRPVVDFGNRFLKGSSFSTQSGRNVGNVPGFPRGFAKGF